MGFLRVGPTASREEPDPMNTDGEGKVYLVGAGPGDPDLLTKKAAKILSHAEVVLHDDLVSAEILELISSTASVQNVGKRCGRPHLGQEEIHSRMVAFAKKGLIVVRLKGGDPMLYGRAGEEMDALRRAGVEFEVVPGISAVFGVAAAARISLTDRRIASKVLILSNHLCNGEDAPIDSNSISADTTVVVYMPGAGYAELAAKLCAAGFNPRTCCIVVSSATTEVQKIHVSTLERLPLAPNLPAPALLIVGNVVEHHIDVEHAAKIVRTAIDSSDISSWI